MTITTSTRRRKLLEALHIAIGEQHRPGVERALDHLIFDGATVYDPRGISDAALPTALLERVYWALPKDCTWKECILEHLVALGQDGS